MKAAKDRFELSVRRIFPALCVVFFVFAPLITSTSAQTRKAAPKAQFRSITVISEPNASVWLNGVKYGKTAENGKLAISSVSPGRHTIRVRADGFKEVSTPLLPTQKGDVEVALTKTTDEAELAFQQAELFATSDRDAAIEAYNKAIKLRPKYVDAYIGLARIYSETGNFEKAENAIRDVRKARPGYAEASAIEGRLLTTAGNAPKAITTFKRAIAEGKGFQPEAYTGLGLLYKEKAEGFGGGGDYEQESANYVEAAKYFAVAVKQLSGSPDGLVVYQLLGLVYEQQKKYKEAIAVYEEFLRLFPDTPESTAVRSFIVQLKKQMSDPK